MKNENKNGSKTDMKALLVTDIQNDFCPGGALAIEEGDAIIPLINSLMPKFDLVIATQDWHPADHQSFASQHPGKNIYDMIDLHGIQQVLWPDHCVQGSKGADFHPALDLRPIRYIIRKGSHREIDSYSAFYENDGITATGLTGLLKGMNVQSLAVVGLATDYCVLYSVLDALKEGFETAIIDDACRGVNLPPDNVAKALQKIAEAGGKILQAKDF
jgi:nicotinamidase/pyrazinamidase